jgi:hypothetical protein
MCLDPEGYIHFCYGVEIGFVTALVYSTNRGGSWTEDVIDDQNSSMYASIAVDSNNNVHIAYEADPMWSLHYATNSGGVWTTQLIDGSGQYGNIAIDSHDAPCVVYTVDNGSSSDLKLAWLSGGLWPNTTVDTVDSIGYWPSIAFDSADGIHLSYVDYSGNSATLMYAHRMASDWTKSVVEQFVADQAFITSTSIVADSTGYAHIVYMRGMGSSYDAGGGLKYATNSSSAIPEMRVFVVVPVILVVTAIVYRFKKCDST